MQLIINSLDNKCLDYTRYVHYYLIGTRIPHYFLKCWLAIVVRAI